MKYNELEMTLRISFGFSWFIAEFLLTKELNGNEILLDTAFTSLCLLFHYQMTYVQCTN